MDCVKWGNDNSSIKNLPINDAEQAADTRNIMWQDGFDGRFAGEASKFPTKENIDEMLAFISAKHFFKKCGGLNFDQHYPALEKAAGRLPTIKRTINGTEKSVWPFIDQVCSGGFFKIDSDGNIGMYNGVGNGFAFLNPDNRANMEKKVSKVDSFDFSILGSPDNGVCDSLSAGDEQHPSDLIFFPEFKQIDGKGSVIGNGIDLRLLKDRSIAHPLSGASVPSGFNDYPYFFQEESSYFKPPEFSYLKRYFDYVGAYDNVNDRTRICDDTGGENSSVGRSFIYLFRKISNVNFPSNFPKSYSIVDPDDSNWTWSLCCFKAITDFALIFDFQPYLNVVKFTSYGEEEKVKEVATFDNGCVNLKNGFYHNLYMSFGIADIPQNVTWNPPIGINSPKPILIASGGQLVCDRIFVRRGSTFNFFLDTNAPVDFRFKATAIPL